MADKDNITDLLGQFFRNRQAEMRVAMPAKITDYDYRTQKATVKPLINRRYADDRIEEYPVINNVPVIFPRSGGASLTFPVESGDTVLLVFSDRSIESWAENGGQVNQDDNRMHNINDAVAIPGLIPFSLGSIAENNEDVLLSYSDSQVKLKPGGIVEINTAAKVVINSPDINLGGEGGARVARIGDRVNVSGGSSAGLWPIVEGSEIVKAV